MVCCSLSVCFYLVRNSAIIIIRKLQRKADSLAKFGILQLDHLNRSCIDKWSTACSFHECHEKIVCFSINSICLKYCTKNIFAIKNFHRPQFSQIAYTRRFQWRFLEIFSCYLVLKIDGFQLIWKLFVITVNF